MKKDEPPTAEPTRPDEWWELVHQVEQLQLLLRRAQDDLDALEQMLRNPF